MLDRVGAAVLGVALAVKLGHAFLTGPVLAPDTRRFVAIASGLPSSPEAPITAAGAPAFYSLYSALLAGLWAATGSLVETYAVLVWLQAIASAASVYVLFRTLLGLSGSRPLFACGLAGLFLLNPEILVWDAAITADSINLSLLIASLSVLTGRFGALPRARSARRFALLMLLFLTLSLCRPTNLVFLSVSLLALSFEGSSPNLVRKLGGATLAGLVVLAAVGLLRYGQAGARSLTDLLLRYARAGTVIDGRPTYDVAPPDWDAASSTERTTHLVRTFAKRLVYFWAPVLRGYSRRHTMVSLALLGGVWLVGVLAMSRIWLRSRPALVDRYLVSVIVAYNVFHAATVIDFDMRYRIVVVPFVLALIARGFRSGLPRREGQGASR